MMGRRGMESPGWSASRQYFGVAVKRIESLLYWISMLIDFIILLLLIATIGLTIIPSVPAVPFMFLLTLAYAAIGRFEVIDGQGLIIFAILALATVVIDYSSGLIGAKFGGASKRAILGGMLGMLFGLVLLPPFGAFIGLFLGVLVTELVQFGSHVKAFKAASYSLAAVLAGMLVNVAIALAFVIIFAIKVF